MSNLAHPMHLRPLTQEEGGGWLAEFPDLPGCVADGETPEEAVREAEDALRSWLESARLHGDPIPEPSRPDTGSYSGKWVIRAPKSLHKRLVERARQEGVSLNTMAVSLLSEGVGARTGRS